MTFLTPGQPPPACPRCGSSAGVVPILYGLVEEPLPGAGVDFILGGCCFRDDAWYCKNCQANVPDSQG